jgi:acetyltransferase-like isoleucine patch superfamily enzyme
MIPKSVKLYGDVEFGEDCVVGEYTLINYPYKTSIGGFKDKKKTSIGKKCIIGSHVIIYGGTKIGDETMIEDFCKIGEDVSIGNNCHILYGDKIYEGSIIDDNCIIGGFICERAKIGKNVRIFGELIHSHREPHLGWDDIIEKSPVIEDYVFIGFGAKIIGGIKISKNSYIVAGAIVTKDVPEKSIVSEVNKIIPYNEWKGHLGSSKFFKCSQK